MVAQDILVVLVLVRNRIAQPKEAWWRRHFATMFFFCPPGKCAPNFVILLTFCFPEVLPESVRMDRWPADLHLSHAEKGKKWGLETYETCFPDVRYEASKRQFHVWHTFTCWFTVIYMAKYSWIPHGCKYLQPRMQTFATEVANVCVRKFIHSSAWGNAFCWPSFQMEMGTWKSSLEQDLGYKTAPKRLFRHIWSEIKRLS